MTNKFSILFLIDSLTEGGAELALLVLVRALCAQHHHVSVLSIREPSGLYSEFLGTGAKVYIPNEKTSHYRIDGFKRLRKLMSNNRFDFVHASSRTTSMFLALGVALPLHGYRIVTFQDVHYKCNTKLSFFQRMKESTLLTLLYSTCHGFTTDSKQNIDDFKKYTPYLPLVWMPNCIVPPPIVDNLNEKQVRASIQCNTNDFLIIIPARYVIQKGHIIFFSALSKLRAEGAKLPRVVCYGEGDQIKLLLTYLQENQLDDVVSINGKIPIDELQKYMLVADLIALPSLWESFGQVVASAMALGKPVLGSDTGGIREQIKHEETGYLVPPGDVDAWALAISNAMKSKSQLVAIGQRGKEVADKTQSAEQIGEMLIEFYSEIILKKRRQ